MSVAPTRRASRVLFVLPPDFDAPLQQKVHRFPPQGPALVAASIAPDGWSSRLVDLERSVIERPLAADPAPAADEALVAAYLRGERVPALEDFIDELAARVDLAPDEHLAISMERHTQMSPAVLLAHALKRRLGAPSLIGGTAARQCRAFLDAVGARGVDLVTRAESPTEIRAAFEALRSLSRGRMEPAVDPVPDERPTPPDEWPVADFSLYDLARYRRDPIAAEGAYRGYDGRVGPRLVLPYHFTFACQFACAFCQNGGTQRAKSPERAVRDLATLAERHDAADFMLFDTQINLEADGFARALAAANLGLRWSDSYRVTPHTPGELELMARAGCAGITVGVESASDEMLQRMVKGHRKRHATRTVREAHDAGMYVRVNLLTCFPGERARHHEETRAWVREQADAIDDLAPSSFYLLDDAPVGQQAERFGVRVRGPRRLEGSYRFRKFIGALAFDEVDGLTWEEREPMLRRTEDELREAWSEGRAHLGVPPGMKSAMMLGLRAVFDRKADAYAALASWCGGPRERAVARPVETADVCAPTGPADAPSRVARIEADPVADEALASRVRRALAAAEADVARYARSGARSHVLLFVDDDYLCFSSRDESPTDGAVAIENVLSSRFTSATRRRLYGRLRPGARVSVDEGGLVVADARGAAQRHPEPARLVGFTFRWA